MGDDHQNTDKLTFYVNAMSREFIMFLFGNTYVLYSGDDGGSPHAVLTRTGVKHMNIIDGTHHRTNNERINFVKYHVFWQQ